MVLGKKRGIIKWWFNGERGYGFIHPNNGGEAVFVHHTSVAPYAKAKALSKGAQVTYEIARRKMGGAVGKGRLYSGLTPTLRLQPIELKR